LPRQPRCSVLYDQHLLRHCVEQYTEFARVCMMRGYIFGRLRYVGYTCLVYVILPFAASPPSITRRLSVLHADAGYACGSGVVVVFANNICQVVDVLMSGRCRDAGNVRCIAKLAYARVSRIDDPSEHWPILPLSILCLTIHIPWPFAATIRPTPAPFSFLPLHLVLYIDFAASAAV
jgi:hypothetical protein